MGRYSKELVSLLWRILGNEQDVLDAYQTTFLYLARRSEKQGPHYLKAYLFRTASNVAVSMLRTSAAEQRRRQAWPVKKEGPSPTASLERQEGLAKLRTYLPLLPEHLRVVVTLRDLAELPYSIIAKQLGISTGTARVYRCKAVNRLAHWMAANT